MVKKAADGVTDPTDEVEMSLEELALAIEKMSDLGERLLKTRLKKRTLMLLIRDACSNKVGLSEIEQVLHALPRLKDKYLYDVKQAKAAR